MERTKKIIVAGHICLDITPVFEKKGKMNLGEILTPGKLVQVGNADVHTGGVVANTGLAMKLFGADVKLMGKIGSDAFGGMIQNILKSYGSEEDLIVDEKSFTSYSVVIAPPGVDRIFLHNPGANDTFCEEDLPVDKLAGNDLLHFGYPPLMGKMYEADGRALKAIFQRAKGLGMMTSLDMANVDADSKAGHADWQKILEQVLPFVDFFLPSIEELGFMLDKAQFEEWRHRAGDGDITEVLDLEEDVKPMAEQLIKMGTKVVIIKCGAPGLYYKTAEDLSALDGLSSDWEGREGFQESYKPEQVISGTGAGDTTIAAFLVAMTKGYSLEKCLQYGTATGASCVEAVDALTGLRSFAEIDERIETGWPKNKFNKEEKRC